MTNKKTTSAKVEESNSQVLYLKKARRSRLDRRIRFLFILNCILVLLFGSLFWVNTRLRNDLASTLTLIEKAQAENDQLYEELETLQSEKDELQASYDALVTLINNEEPVEREICSTSTFKSWMDYRTITNRSSKQYQLQQAGTTDKNFGFRMVDGYLLVAMGPQYGPVGTKYIIQFEDSKVINAMIGDIKHQGCTSSDSSMIEFIVDTKILPAFIKSSGNFNRYFNGSITMIREVES